MLFVLDLQQLQLTILISSYVIQRYKSHIKYEKKTNLYPFSLTKWFALSPIEN